MSQILQELPTDTENFSQLFPTGGVIYELFPEIVSEQDLGKRQDITWVENDYVNSKSLNLNRTNSFEIKYTEDISKAPDTFLFASESAVVSKENDSTENFSRILSDSHLQKSMDKNINDSILPAQSFPPKSKKGSANTTKKNANATKKRGKKENKRIKQEKKQEENIKVEQDQKKENIKLNHDQENQNAEVKQEESEDCIDVETVPDEIPVLQASDVESLLEQFEASEKQEVLSIQCNKAEIKKDSISFMNSTKTQQVTKKEDQSNMPKKSLRTCIPQQKSPPKEVIDRIKASAQKRYISIIPAMPETAKHYETIRKPIASYNNIKPYESISNRFKRSSNINRASIIRDHDYCNPILANSLYLLNNLKSNKNEMIDKICNKTKEHDNNSKKQLNHSTRLKDLFCNPALKLNGTNKFDEIQNATSTLANTKTDKINDIAPENKYKRCQKIALEQYQGNNSSSIIHSVKNVNAPNKYSKRKSIINENDMKIRSALAASIIESRNNMQASGKIQMVSVLKKPPNISQPSLLKSNSSENVVSIPSNADKYLERVQDLIVQNTPESPSHEEEKKQPRKKLNLAEYRNRRDLNSNKTNSPAQRTWKYVYHASTMTEPIKDNFNNPIWSERDFTMEESNVEEAKNKAKLQTRNIGIQVGEESEERKENDIKREDINKENPNNKHNLSSSLSKSSLQSKTKRKRSRSKSRSRSRTRTSIENRTENKRSRSRSIIIIDTDDSKSKSRSRSRSRNRSSSKSISRSRSKSRTRTGIRIRTRSRTRSRSRSRSRSRTRSRSMSRSRSRSRSCRSRRSNTRRRRLSHRRSSVSSVSSWSSQSRSYGTSTSRSSSRSRTSSHYNSSCSRSSSRSEFERNRWSNHHRNNDERERNYEKYQRHSFNSHHAYRDLRSSPKHSYNTSYDPSDRYRETKRNDVEQRKILYVGRLNEGVTKADLINRFEYFGSIKNISLHFHKNGNNYGFVTFENRTAAYNAKEHGNDNTSLPEYDLSFGGRRTFCQDTYTDLDNMSSSLPSNRLSQRDEDTFDKLLQTAQDRIKKKV